MDEHERSTGPNNNDGRRLLRDQSSASAEDRSAPSDEESVLPTLRIAQYESETEASFSSNAGGQDNNNNNNLQEYVDRSVARGTFGNNSNDDDDDDDDDDEEYDDDSDEDKNVTKEQLREEIVALQHQILLAETDANMATEVATAKADESREMEELLDQALEEIEYYKDQYSSVASVSEYDDEYPLDLSETSYHSANQVIPAMESIDEIEEEEQEIIFEDDSSGDDSRLFGREVKIPAALTTGSSGESTISKRLSPDKQSSSSSSSSSAGSSSSSSSSRQRYTNNQRSITEEKKSLSSSGSSSGRRRSPLEEAKRRRRLKEREKKAKEREEKVKEREQKQKSSSSENSSPSGKQLFVSPIRKVEQSSERKARRVRSKRKRDEGSSAAGAAASATKNPATATAASHATEVPFASPAPTVPLSEDASSPGGAGGLSDGRSIFVGFRWCTECWNVFSFNVPDDTKHRRRPATQHRRRRQQQQRAILGSFWGLVFVGLLLTIIFTLSGIGTSYYGAKLAIERTHQGIYSSEKPLTLPPDSGTTQGASPPTPTVASSIRPSAAPLVVPSTLPSALPSVSPSREPIRIENPSIAACEEQEVLLQLEIQFGAKPADVGIVLRDKSLDNTAIWAFDLRSVPASTQFNRKNIFAICLAATSPYFLQVTSDSGDGFSGRWALRYHTELVAHYEEDCSTATGDDGEVDFISECGSYCACSFHIPPSNAGTITDDADADGCTDIC